LFYHCPTFCVPVFIFTEFPLLFPPPRQVSPPNSPGFFPPRPANLWNGALCVLLFFPCLFGQYWPFCLLFSFSAPKVIRYGFFRCPEFFPFFPPVFLFLSLQHRSVPQTVTPPPGRSCAFCLSPPTMTTRVCLLVPPF